MNTGGSSGAAGYRMAIKHPPWLQTSRVFVMKYLPYILAYKSRNFGRNMVLLFTFRLICGSKKERSAYGGGAV